jgi:hypothetical protein
MKVRTIVDCQDICPNLFEGSVLQDVVERKKSYYGVFSSFMGSYHVTVPKGKCEIINEDLDCHYSGLPSPKVYDMENNPKQNPIDFLQEKYNSRQVYEESIFDEEFEQAKAMYEQAIMNAWGDGYDEGLYDGMYK